MEQILRHSYIVSTIAADAPDDAHKIHCIEPILPLFWLQHQKGKSYILRQNYAD